MKAKFKHTWIRLQDPNESAKFYTQVPEMKEIGRSKIEKVTGSFEALISSLRLTKGIMHKPLGFKLGRSWESHSAERDFQTRHAAARTISESQGKIQVVR